MASNKKTDEDRAREKADYEERHASRRMGLAEVDLRWYYGTGASSARGDMGVRSSLGGQLDAMRLGAASNRGVDVSASTDRMDEAVEAVRRERCIKARLAPLKGRHQRILRLAFSEGKLPGGLPPLAIMTTTARESWSTEVAKMAKRWVNGVAVGLAMSDAGGAPTPRRPPPAQALSEASEAASRWATDDLLLADHMAKISPTTRAAIFDEVATLTAEALQAFALRVCWDGREVNYRNDLSQRRCDRCGHHDPSRRADEQRARQGQAA